MSPLGPIYNATGNDSPFLGREMGTARKSDLSEVVSARIDKEIRNVIESSLEAAQDILTKNKAAMDKMVDDLMEHETLNADQLNKVLLT